MRPALWVVFLVGSATPGCDDGVGHCGTEPASMEVGESLTFRLCGSTWRSISLPDGGLSVRVHSAEQLTASLNGKDVATGTDVRVVGDGVANSLDIWSAGEGWDFPVSIEVGPLPAPACGAQIPLPQSGRRKVPVCAGRTTTVLLPAWSAVELRLTSRDPVTATMTWLDDPHPLWKAELGSEPFTWRYAPAGGRLSLEGAGESEVSVETVTLQGPASGGVGQALFRGDFRVIRHRLDAMGFRQAGTETLRDIRTLLKRDEVFMGAVWMPTSLGPVVPAGVYTHLWTGLARGPLFDLRLTDASGVEHRVVIDRFDTGHTRGPDYFRREGPVLASGLAILHEAQALQRWLNEHVEVRCAVPDLELQWDEAVECPACYRDGRGQLNHSRYPAALNQLPVAQDPVELRRLTALHLLTACRIGERPAGPLTHGRVAPTEAWTQGAALYLATRSMAAPYQVQLDGEQATVVDLLERTIAYDGDGADSSVRVDMPLRPDMVAGTLLQLTQPAVDIAQHKILNALMAVPETPDRGVPGPDLADFFAALACQALSGPERDAVDTLAGPFAAQCRQ